LVQIPVDERRKKKGVYFALSGQLEWHRGAGCTRVWALPGPN